MLSSNRIHCAPLARRLAQRGERTFLICCRVDSGGHSRRSVLINSN